MRCGRNNLMEKGTNLEAPQESDNREMQRETIWVVLT